MSTIIQSEVIHQPALQRFVIDTQGVESVLSYRLFQRDDRQAIDFNSTYVPPSLRGKGLAEKLVRAGLHWARAQGFELHASCWYVAKFLR